MKANQRFKLCGFLIRTFGHSMQWKQNHILDMENTISAFNLHHTDVQSEGLRQLQAKTVIATIVLEDQTGLMSYCSALHLEISLYKLWC